MGGWRSRGVLYGVAGERLITAVEAFRRPGGPDDRRGFGQRTADALEEVCEAALRGGAAPSRHGVRPHVLVTVEWSQLVRAAGVAELAFTGPVPISELRPLLADCAFSRVVLGPDSVPIEVSKQVRTVPQGLFRAVVTRDRGCTWPGCDAPPGWCDVAHGNLPFRHGGRLKLGDCALLCRRHHRRFDTGTWRMHIDGATVTYQRTTDAEDAGPSTEASRSEQERSEASRSIDAGRATERPPPSRAPCGPAPRLDLEGAVELSDRHAPP